MPGKVRVIPANTNEPMKHVVIYARVSSNTMDQLESLKTQVSGLTKFISGHNNWKLVDIHIDIASAKKDSSRPAFHQMIEECKAGLTDIVVVKSISRLGRDTVEVLDAINTLRESQVRIIFKQEELDSLTVGSSLLISTVQSGDHPRLGAKILPAPSGVHPGIPEPSRLHRRIGEGVSEPEVQEDIGDGRFAAFCGTG